MANDETENTKKDALLRDWLRDWKDAPSYVERAFGYRAGWNAGYDAGAASVDRVAIVREAFAKVEEQMKGSPYWAIERDRERFRHFANAVLETMEKGNG